MIWPIILLIAGFVLLIKGADFLVDGASSLARRFKVSELVIGLTIVAFGTSMPELVVNTIASLKHHNDVVLGNIIGSNNFNLFIILGISAIIHPLVIKRSTVIKEIPYSLLAAFVILILCNDMLLFNKSNDILNRIDGIILLSFFGLFLFYIYRNLHDENIKNKASEENVYSLPRTFLFLALGFAGLIIGGKITVDKAVMLSRMLGISERIIGLTVVAAGTSLPELATSAVAAYRKKSDIAVGNIIGSNIFNIFLILGISSLISPVAFSLQFNIDIILLITGTVLILLFTYTGKKAIIDRWEAFILLGAYIIYMLYIISGK
jgi:cation:H+ antiporter